MPKHLTPLSLIRDAWKFYRKQPALNTVLLCLLILPSVLSDLFLQHGMASAAIPDAAGRTIAQASVFLLLTLVTYWGMTGILLVGRRMIQQRAGRGRTSFKAVCKQARPFVMPLFFTSVLRTCFTFYWSLLFVLPALLVLLLVPDCAALAVHLYAASVGAAAIGGLPLLLARCWILLALPLLLLPCIAYSLRTMFSPIAVTADGRRYRSALAQSKDMVRGRFWRVLGMTVALLLLLILPAEVSGTILRSLIEALDPRLSPAGTVLADGVSAFGTLLFTLALIGYYGTLRSGKNLPVEVTPEEVEETK